MCCRNRTKTRDLGSGGSGRPWHCLRVASSSWLIHSADGDTVRSRDLGEARSRGGGILCSGTSSPLCLKRIRAKLLYVAEREETKLTSLLEICEVESDGAEEVEQHRWFGERHSSGFRLLQTSCPSGRQVLRKAAEAWLGAS